MKGITIQRSKDGQYYFLIKARNGKVIATGETYKRRGSALKALAALKKAMAAAAFCFLSCIATAQAAPYYGSVIHQPFTIQVKDSNARELGYFKYNDLTNTVTRRGTYNSIFRYFVKDFFWPAMEREGAARKLFEQINEDGTIKDFIKYKSAVAAYYAILRRQNEAFFYNQ